MRGYFGDKLPNHWPLLLIAFRFGTKRSRVQIPPPRPLFNFNLHHSHRDHYLLGNNPIETIFARIETMESLSHITLFPDFTSAIFVPAKRDSSASHSLLPHTYQNPSKNPVFRQTTAFFSFLHAHRYWLGPQRRDAAATLNQYPSPWPSQGAREKSMYSAAILNIILNPAVKTTAEQAQCAKGSEKWRRKVLCRRAFSNLFRNLAEPIIKIIKIKRLEEKTYPVFIHPVQIFSRDRSSGNQGKMTTTTAFLYERFQ